MGGENSLGADLAMALWHDYEPKPVDEDAEQYYAYLTDKAQALLTDPTLVQMGTDQDEELKAALHWKVWEHWQKTCKNKVKMYQNIVLNQLINRRAYVITYGDLGRLALVQSSGKPYPKNSLKVDPVSYKIDRQLPDQIDNDDMRSYYSPD